MTHHPLAYLWHHPRRTGFIAFNLVAIALFISWGAFTASMTNDGLAGIPNLMLGYTGMAFLVLAWVAGWGAWAYMVARRHARQQPGQQSGL